MAVNPVSNLFQTTEKKSERNTGALGKDDFLNLLVTQLRYQDPLKPMEDKEFISQMAQFSSLEQMQNLNKVMTNSQAFSLIGKYITATNSDKTTGKVYNVEGLVSNIKMNNGKTYVVVNKEEIPIENVSNVFEGKASSGADSLATYTGFVGFNVNGAVYDSKSGSIVPVNGKVVALEVGKYEDYAILDGVKAQVSGYYDENGELIEDSSKLEKYLKEASEKNDDKKVTLQVVDSKTGKKVSITANLNVYSLVDNKFNVTLNNVYTPVDSISKVSN